jgi:hypothetical protein
MGTDLKLKETMNTRNWLAGMCVGFAVAGSAAAATNVNVSVDGQVSPGVYGRIEIGNTPPPVLVYQQPVVIVRQVRPVQAAPIYLHVPPGHARNWSKHCGRYNACGQPVYFVRSVEYEPGYGRKYKHEDRHDDEHGNGKGRGHGRGHGRDD